MAQFARLKPATILVVENEAIVRMEAAASLTDLGLTVLTADGADQAIALLDSHPEIEILFTDLKMPGSMDGMRLTHHVRGRWPPVKIIVASGLWTTKLSDLPTGSVFLAKPYAPDALIAALRDVSNGAAQVLPTLDAG